MTATGLHAIPGRTVALVQRGTCTFRVKADNAAAAGASAVIAMNEGQPGRTAAVAGDRSVRGTVPAACRRRAAGVVTRWDDTRVA